MKRWRQKLKDNPEQYAAHRSHETLRCRNIRQNMTEEQRACTNETARLRMIQYRLVHNLKLCCVSEML